jgi:hypothetical protein
MLVVPHLPEREAVAPEVAPAAVAGVEALRVEAVHALQRGRQRIAKALDDEVVVVRQQAEGLSLEPEALDGAAELAEEAARVVGVEKTRRRPTPRVVTCQTPYSGNVLRARRGIRPRYARTSPNPPLWMNWNRIVANDTAARDVSGDCPRTRPS